jgi:GT2 family glycosyltransferase
METNKKVLVIIISYKTSELMPRLLRSINEDHINPTILILDNSSTTETVKPLLELEDSRVVIIKSEANLGFTGGLNYSLDYAINNMGYFEYFFLLNPDAFSCNNLIGNLLKVIGPDKNIAAVSPKIINTNSEVWYSGANINYKKGEVINNSIKTVDDSVKTFEIDVFSGCAVLFRTSKVLEAGKFNEDLFMYYDEADMSIKLKKLGCKIVYVPNLQIFHEVSYTTKKISHLKTYYMTRNKFMVFNNTMNFSDKLYFLIYEFLFHLKNRRLLNIKFHLIGYMDFLKNKKGVCNVTC